MHCNVDDFPITFIKQGICYKSDVYSLNLMAPKDDNDNIIILRPGTRIRSFGKYKSKQIRNYKLIQGKDDRPIEYSCNDVLDKLNVRVYSNYEKFSYLSGSTEQISCELISKITMYFHNICISNDNARIIIHSINSLDEKYISEVNDILSKNQFYKNMYKANRRVVCNIKHLINLIKITYPSIYENELKSEIDRINTPDIKGICLKSDFMIKDMFDMVYNSEKEATEDLSRVICCNQSEGIYFLKSFDSVKKKTYIKFTHEDFCKRVLKKKTIK